MKRTILIFISFFLISLMTAQDVVTLSAGPAGTQSGQAALALALKLFDSYGAIMDKTQIVAGDKWYMYMAPQVNTNYGSGDAFTGFTVKATGMFRFYKPHEVGGTVVPDETTLSWVVPFSMDVETNKDFDNFNIIGEIGLIPWWKTIANAKHLQNKVARQLCSNTNFAIFMQGGNKVGSYGPSDSVPASSGNAVLSRETLNGGICRLKIMANFAPTLLKANKGDFELHLKGEATYWYDFLNKVSYYMFEVALDAQITKNLGVDFRYQKGSGAPNFNEGNQFGGNLNIRF